MTNQEKLDAFCEEFNLTQQLDGTEIKLIDSSLQVAATIATDVITDRPGEFMDVCLTNLREKFA